MAIALLHIEMHNYFSRNEVVSSSIKREAPKKIVESKQSRLLSFQRVFLVLYSSHSITIH